MKQFEKDMITLGLINDFLLHSNRNIIDVIPDFNALQVSDLLQKIDFMKNEESAELAFKEFVNQTYNRIKKKFPKEKVKK